MDALGAARSWEARLGVLFVVSPHPKHLYDALSPINLIDQAMLNIDSTGVCARQIADQFFVRRWILERVFRDYSQEALDLGLQIGGGYLTCVLLCLPGENNGPIHQPGLVEDLRSGSFIPARMELRMPGIERR